MTQITVATWNTQGNPQNDPAKLAALVTLLNTVDFVCIQEAGQLALQNPNRDVWRWNNYYGVGIDHAGAFNQRCATAIMSRHEIFLEPSFSIPPTYREFRNPQYLGSGVGRFCIFASCRNPHSKFMIGSAHASASNNAGVDLGTVLDQILRVDFPIIVGGDWNTAPTSLTRYQNNIASSGQVTHPSTGTELDYFCFNHQCNITTQPIVKQTTQPISDHFPVVGEFAI